MRIRLLVVIGIVFTSILIVGPFAWLLFSSLKPPEELFLPSLIPSRLTLHNYSGLFSETLILRFLINSVIVALSVTLLTIAVSVLAAYSLVFFRYPGRVFFGRMLLFAYMFPGVVIIVPTYEIVSRWGLTNTLLGVTVVELVLTVPFSVWMLRGFFSEIPLELEEAARIDGCSKLQALFHVLLPVSRPGIIAVAVFSFIFSWNEYLFPLILVNNEAAKTLPLGVAGFMGHLNVEWGPLLAAGVVSVAPILILFTFLQRFLITGITAGAVKG